MTLTGPLNGAPRNPPRHPESTRHARHALEGTDKGTAGLHFTLDGELQLLLDDLAKSLCTTRGEVLRKALALLEIAVGAQQHGNRLGVIDREGNVLTALVGLQETSP